MVPRAAGGLELPLADIVDVYEEVARADGSTGWCFFATDLTAAYFGAYLPDEGVAGVFADGVPLMAGQFAPNGTAVADGLQLLVDRQCHVAEVLILREQIVEAPHLLADRRTNQLVVVDLLDPR